MYYTEHKQKRKKKHGRLGNEAKVDCDLRSVRHSPFMDQAQMLVFNTMQNKDRSLNKYNNEHLNNTGPLYIAIAIKIADKIPNTDTYELIANVQTFHTLN